MICKGGIFINGSTIAAIATPLGEGAVGIIRISGNDAFTVVDRIFKSTSGKRISEIKGYTALFGTVYDGEERIDDAVVLKFCSPKSYTGEDVAEIQVHGGRIIIRQVLRCVLKHGATLAEPGEFTKRAFLNGKMDLTKAESIMNLISAKSKSEVRMANASYIGKVSEKINALEQMLLDAASDIAVYSDYPEEYLPELGSEVFKSKLKAVKESLDKMISDYDTGSLLREGISTAIVGKPNVGKSTLMNLLSGADRSIVTDIAGTTRDVIEDTVTVGDITLRLADTAGIHETQDKVESVGVTLAKERLESADLILAVFDTSEKADQNDILLANEIKNRTAIAVLNKTDKKIADYTPLLKGVPTVEISAKNGQGTDRLAQLITKTVIDAEFDPDSAVLMNERQRDAAYKAKMAIEEAYNALLSGITIDAVGVCVDDALAALALITGKRVTTEVADEIFRKFCVGK